MSRPSYQVLLAIVLAQVITSAGCSTLGLSMYPSGASLTTEAKEVLGSSRIPNGIPRENAKMVLPPHALQPGDALLIEPINLERDLRLPADQVVLADGTVDLGPYGRVVVAGRNLEQAESLIEQQIVDQMQQQASDRESDANGNVQAFPDNPLPTEDFETIAVNVRLLETVHRFYVLGEVNAPGSYPLTGSETVLDAIVNAGGLTTSANPCQILLARPTDPCECRVTLPVCYREIVQMGNTSTNYQLQPGDRVFVATRGCMDELMFWRASQPCERCAGCNRACRNPEFVTAKPMTMVENTMIPPGSVGWMRPANDPLRTPGLVEPDEAPSDPATSLGEYLNEQPIDPTDGNPATDKTTPTDRSILNDADVDGELEFSPPSP